MLTYLEFYQRVDLPSFAPPPWVFGVAWSIIYPLIMAAFVWYLVLAVRKRAPMWLLWVFAGNITANLLFTPIQLGLRPLWPASIDILIVVGTLAYFMARAWRYSRPVVWLLTPYLLWGVFATVLQMVITLTN